MPRKTTLETLVRDSWAENVVSRHGAPGARAALVWDADRPVLTVTDERTVTWEYLNWTAGNDTVFVAALDSQIMALIRRHANPYNRYPLTGAANELEYL